MLILKDKLIKKHTTLDVVRQVLPVVSKFRTINWKAIELELALMQLRVPFVAHLSK